MTDETKEPNPLPKVEIAITPDGLDAEITVDGRALEGVRRYRIEHERDQLCCVTLEIWSEVSITGPGIVASKAAEA